MPQIELDEGGTGWGSLDKVISRDNMKSRFFRLYERDQPFQIRIVSSPFIFMKHWEAFKESRNFPISPDINASEMAKDVAWYLGGFKPTARMACLIIDREDEKVKVFEFGGMILRPLNEYRQWSGINPAGPSAPDMAIKVFAQHGVPFKRYDVAQVGGSEGMTNEDAFKVQSCAIDIKEMYPIPPPEDVLNLWLSLEKEKRYSPVQMTKMESAVQGMNKASEAEIRAYAKEHGDLIMVEAFHDNLLGSWRLSGLPHSLRECYLAKFIDFNVLPFRTSSEEELLAPMIEEVEAQLFGGWED